MSVGIAERFVLDGVREHLVGALTHTRRKLSARDRHISRRHDELDARRVLRRFGGHAGTEYDARVHETPLARRRRRAQRTADAQHAHRNLRQTIVGHPFFSRASSAVPAACDSPMRAKTDTVKKSLATPISCGRASTPAGSALMKSPVCWKYFTPRCATTARA